MLGFGKSLLMLFHFLAFFLSSFVYTLSSLCAQIQMLGFKDNSDCISKNYRCEGKHTWCFFFFMRSIVLSSKFNLSRVDFNIVAHWAERLHWNIMRSKLLIPNSSIAIEWRCSAFRGSIGQSETVDLYAVNSSVGCSCDRRRFDFVLWCVHVIHQNHWLRPLLLCWLAYFNQLISRYCLCIGYTFALFHQHAQQSYTHTQRETVCTHTTAHTVQFRLDIHNAMNEIVRSLVIRQLREQQYHRTQNK